MYLQVTQHPHTFFKSQPISADASENAVIKLNQDSMIQIDRIVMHDKYDFDIDGPENISEYQQHHKVVCSYPIGENQVKAGYIFAPHVEVKIPRIQDQQVRLLMPRSKDGAFLKQGTGDRATMGDDNLFHLHEGQGRYLKSIMRVDETHYKVELSELLNGKRNWYVLKEEVEIWLESTERRFNFDKEAPGRS